PAAVHWERRLANVPAFAVRDPQAVPAADAGLADDEPVLGVVVAGRARAYLVRAMSGEPRLHVVNDRLGGRPVSVSYCDRPACAHAFTGEPGEALDLAMGGFMQGQMVLRANGAVYAQATLQPLGPGGGPFPFGQLDFTRTTWKEWRTAHPDTDV